MSIDTPNMRRKLTASLLGSVGCSPLQGAVQSQTLLASRMESASTDLGICTHFSQGHGEPSLWLPRLIKNGWVSIRDEVYWNHVENQSGQLRIPALDRNYLNASKSAGVKVMVVLGYGHSKFKMAKPIDKDVVKAYCNYVEFVTSNLAQDVSIFEIWNEWDIEIGGAPGSHEVTYNALLAEVVPIIRKNAPKAIVIGCSATPESVDKGYLKRLQSLGSFELLDGLSIHPYVYSKRYNNKAIDCKRWVEEVASSLSVRGKPPHLYITEIGWPTHDAGIFKQTISEREQAVLLKDTVALLRQLDYVKGIWWYTLFDSPGNKTDPETSFGLVRTDQSAKPAFFGLSKSA
jgi:polysaccharide biosynthesis protein PslG